jgi:hypothetical protein
MIELLGGTGRLVSRTNPPNTVDRVEYKFKLTTKVVETPDFLKVAADRYGEGDVRSFDNESIPEGDYDLHTTDEVLRVRHVAGRWMVLS